MITPFAQDLRGFGHGLICALLVEGQVGCFPPSVILDFEMKKVTSFTGLVSRKLTSSFFYHSTKNFYPTTHSDPEEMVHETQPGDLINR